MTKPRTLHPVFRVEAFEITGPYRLRVRFNDDSEQDIDFRPVLEGELFMPLQSLAVFNAVQLDRETGTLTWPNGADFDPATLHDWPDRKEQFVRMVRGWSKGSRGTGTFRTRR